VAQIVYCGIHFLALINHFLLHKFELGDALFHGLALGLLLALLLGGLLALFEERRRRRHIHFR